MILIAANGTGKSWCSTHVASTIDIEIMKYALPGKTYEDRVPLYAIAAQKLASKYRMVFIPVRLAQRFPEALAITLEYPEMKRRIVARGDWNMHQPVMGAILKGLRTLAKQKRLHLLSSDQHLSDVLKTVGELPLVTVETVDNWIKTFNDETHPNET